MAATPADGRNADDIHVPFLAAALLLGVLGGFTLAVSLPVEAALGRLDAGWVAHAQVHGHVQVIGFAGLFVLGVGLRLAPRFGRGTVAAPGLVRPGWALLVAGVLIRVVAQPLADQPAFAALLIAGAFAELLGAAAFAVVFGGTLAPALRVFQPHAMLLFGSTAWLVVQAALGAVWLTALAVEGGTLLGSVRNTLLVHLQLFGVLLSAILGVGMRSFPTFFGMPPTSLRLGRLIALSLNLGLACWVVATLLATVHGADTTRLTGAGTVAVGLATVLAVATFGLARWKHRLAASSRGFVWALQPVFAWLVLTGLGLAWIGARSLIGGGRPDVAEVDAVRHVFTVGVVTLAILGMAQLILPEFASERIAHPPAPWRGAAFGVALSVAVVLRGLLPWAGLAEAQRFWLMGLGGAIALVATVAFAGLYWRARRRHVAYMGRIAALRSRGTPLDVVNRA